MIARPSGGINAVRGLVARLLERAPTDIAPGAVQQPTAGTRGASLFGCRGPAKWLSMPLATAAVASLAMALLVMDIIPTQAITVEADADPTIEPPVEASHQAALPEPAAGPAAEDADDALQTRQQRSTSLPEIPDVPPSLDDVARELQRRRQEILELEAALALREAAVRAAEADLVAELERLEAFQRSLESLVGQAEAEEAERLAQLVKMYESMRAKSAAAIFDRLEMSVILAVAKRMREAKMAAILAAMDPNRARLVTTELAREQTLPQLE